jgi:polysaccharide export outer membrane protein
VETQAADPAPQPSEQAIPPGGPQLKPNPLVALRAFEPAPDEQYRFGKGDEIVVDFAGRPDLQGKLVVGPDGRISLPLAGEILLNGLTRDEGAKAIEAALAPFYSNLSVQITVTKYVSNRILLLGAVDHPGLLTFEGTPTLLEAITRGGLPLTGPNKLPQIPDRCAIYRGSNQVLWVELKTLIESGNPLADLRLRRDDVIYVPNMAERFVSVLGEVQHPGPVPLTNQSTLASVLATAGGTTERAGAYPHIQIVDPANGTSRTLSMKDLLNPAKSLEVTLHPGQIIYVAQSGLFRATYVVERLSPLLNLATMAVVDGRFW